MRLSAPKQIVWIIAAIVGIVGVVTFFVPAIAVFTNQAFWLPTIGFVLLGLGTLLKGL